MHRTLLLFWALSALAFADYTTYPQVGTTVYFSGSQRFTAFRPAEGGGGGHFYPMPTYLPAVKSFSFHVPGVQVPEGSTLNGGNLYLIGGGWSFAPVQPSNYSVVPLQEDCGGNACPSWGEWPGNMGLYTTTRFGDFPLSYRPYERIALQVTLEQLAAGLDLHGTIEAVFGTHHDSMGRAGHNSMTQIRWDWNIPVRPQAFLEVSYTPALQPVPEPATVAITSVGLVLLWWRHRK